MPNAITTQSITLPAEVSDEIFAKTINESLVMALVPSTPLSGRGETIPVVLGEPEAGWTAETEKKPVSTHTLTQKTMQPYTLSLIEPFSNQFRDNAPVLYSALVERLPRAIALAFDQTVFGYKNAPGTNFDTLTSAATVSLADSTYDGLVSAIGVVATAGYSLNGWVFAPAGETALLLTKDTSGHPLFVPNPTSDGAPSTVLARPAYFSLNAANTSDTSAIGFAGDWRQARYGLAKEINVSVSDQSTLTVGEESWNLWERNMFAVRIECEVGFVTADAAAFVKLTGDAANPGRASLRTDNKK